MTFDPVRGINLGMMLWAYMHAHGLTDAAMAARVGNGCSHRAIRKLRTGEGRPSLERAYAIERATDARVTLADWQYVPRNRFYRRGVRNAHPPPVAA